MKISTHTYGKSVFASLLDGIEKDITYNPPPKKKQPPVTGLDVFSSTGESDFENVQNEELQNIMKELEFAADKIKIELSHDQLAEFTKEAKGLRGKSLEKAARLYCSKIQHETSAPIANTRNSHSSDLLTIANKSSIVPAGYNPEYGPNETKTGGYMGMSKNPNTIWDSTKLDKAAIQISNDERIKQSKEAKEQFNDNQKQEYWKAIQTKLADDKVIQGKTASAANVSTVESAGNQRLSANSMSMFDNKRDFESIPEKTAGETLKEASQTRANKKESAKNEWNKSEPALNTKSYIDKFFEGLAEK